MYMPGKEVGKGNQVSVGCFVFSSLLDDEDCKRIVLPEDF
jgi:hypothetical protein